MSISSAIARKNRQLNSGSIFPDSKSFAVTLAIFLAKLANLDKRFRARCTITALFLWFTGRWTEIKSPSDIPDFMRVSGAGDCQNWSFRTIYDRSVSWCEYAHPYENEGKIHYLWHPIPPQFNSLFQSVISQQRYKTRLLNDVEKDILFKLMKNSWKTPISLQQHSRVNKRKFLQYFTLCFQRDSRITAAIKGQLLPHHQQIHTSASAYQAIESDDFRAVSLNAFQEYLERLLSAARGANLHQRFVCHGHKMELY